MYVIYGMLIYILIQYFPLDSHNIYYPGDTGPVQNTSRVTQSFKHLLKPRLFWCFWTEKGFFFVCFFVKWPLKKSRGGGSLAYVNPKPKYLWQVYLQKIWSISLRLYVIWTGQLIHSNKHIRFAYFESRVAPPTVLNRRIFLITFVSRPWFSFYFQYCLQQTTFVHSLHSFIISDNCSDSVNRDSAQRKSVIVFFCHISHHIFSLFHQTLRPPQGQKWSWKRKRMKREIWKVLQRRGRMRTAQCRAYFWQILQRRGRIRTPKCRAFFWQSL